MSKVVEYRCDKCRKTCWSTKYNWGRLAIGCRADIDGIHRAWRGRFCPECLETFFDWIDYNGARISGK